MEELAYKGDLWPSSWSEDCVLLRTHLGFEFQIALDTYNSIQEQLCHQSIRQYNMSDQNQKPTQKKIIPYRFRIEPLRINIKTLLGSAVSVTFKIGPNESVSDWMTIDKGVAAAATPQCLELESEIIFNPNAKRFQPLKAILKIHLLLQKNRQNEKSQGLAGVVYFDLAEYFNKPLIYSSIQMPISNCSDSNAKIQFKIQFLNISARDQSIKSQSDIMSESMNMLPDSIDISSRIGDSMEESFDREFYSADKNDETQYLKKQLSQLRLKYDQQIKRNSQYADDQLNLIKELKKQKEEIANCKRQIQKYEKQIRKLTLQKRNFENSDKSKQIAKLKQQFESSKRNLIEENQRLQSNAKAFEKERIQYEQKLMKAQQHSYQLQMAKLNKKINELQELLKHLHEQNQDLLIKQKGFTKQIQTLKQTTTARSNKCSKCKQLEQQFRTKQALYEEELATLEGILNQAKAQSKRMTKKYEHKATKSRYYEAKYKQVGDYQEMFTYVIQSIVALLQTLGIKAIENIPQDKDLQPYFFQSIFNELMNQVRHYVLSKPEEERKLKQLSEKILKVAVPSQTQILKKKDCEVTKLNRQLTKLYSRLDDMQQQCDQLRQHSRKIQHKNSIETPRFNEISFSKLPGTQHLEEKNSDYSQISNALQKITEQKRLLEEQLRLMKAFPSFIQRKASKLHQGESQQGDSILRLDEQFSLQHQKDLEAMRKVLGLKQKLNADLDRNYRQLNDEYRQLKNECQIYKDKVNTLRAQIEILKQNNLNKASKILKMSNGLATIEEEKQGTIEEELKELIESIEHDGKVSKDVQQQITARQLSRGNNQRDKKMAQLHQELQRKVYGVNLEFLRMQSMRVSNCKSQQQTRDTILEFNNIRNRMNEVSEFIKQIRNDS